MLERFQAKWRPVRVKKTRQIKESRASFRFYRNGAPRPGAEQGDGGCDSRSSGLAKGLEWTVHGRRRRYRFSHTAAPASPRKGEPPGRVVAAEAGMDPRARAE